MYSGLNSTHQLLDHNYKFKVFTPVSSLDLEFNPLKSSKKSLNLSNLVYILGSSAEHPIELPTPRRVHTKFLKTAINP